MKKEVMVLLLLGMLLVLPLVQAQTYSGFNRFIDNVKLTFSGGDNKANLALDIREKEVNSAISNFEAGDTKNAEKNLNSASEKLKIVQTLASPDISSDVKENIKEIENKINENKGDYELLDNYLIEEEKTKLSMDISEKVFSYCDELAMQDYASMQKDEKCESYVWMEDKIKQRLIEEQEKAKGEIETQVQTCMNNPKDCNCNNIKLLSEKTKCEEFKSSAIKCEFQNDNSACEKIKMFNLQETEREKYEKEIIEKYLPAECSEAGVRDGEECKKLILTLNQPKTECIENGEYVGEEKCKEKLVNQGDVVKECVVDGKLVDPEQCRNIVKEGNKPTGKEFELMSGECKEQGVYDPIACDEIVNLPRPCKDAGHYTKKECESLILNQNLPKECVDAGALTPESCEKLKLPSDCQGAYSRGECEAVFIKKEMPEICRQSGTYDFHKCAKLLYSKVSDISIGGEIEYLESLGINVDEIPDECFKDSSRTNFERDMDCDEALIKEFGIMLPPPEDTSDIPLQCMKDGTPVSPEECEEILGNGIMQNELQNVIPEACKEANVATPEECGNFIEEKRIEEGIGVNMPSECIGISIEECKKIMGEKGIKIEKVEQVQRVERVEKVEKVQKMCKEGEVCDEEPKEYEEVTLPRECIEMGVSDITNCKMIAGRVNEERIKNGEKIIVDEDGKVEYMHPEQIEKIADDSQKASQEIKPDFEKVEEIKKEIKIIEDSIKTIDMQKQDIDSGNNIIDKPQMDKDNEDVTPAPNIIDNNVAPGPEGIVGVIVPEPRDNGPPSDSVDNSVEVGSDFDSDGEDSGMTGAVVGSGNKESFLAKILKGIF